MVLEDLLSLEGRQVDRNEATECMIVITNDSDRSRYRPESFFKR